MNRIKRKNIRLSSDYRKSIGQNSTPFPSTKQEYKLFNKEHLERTSIFSIILNSKVLMQGRSPLTFSAQHCSVGPNHAVNQERDIKIKTQELNHYSQVTRLFT